MIVQEANCPGNRGRVRLLAINFQLVLTDEAASSLARELATERQTYYEQKSPHRTSMQSPFQQKQESVKQVREQLYQEATDWLRGRVPGYFSSLAIPKLPTVEFVTFAQAKPFERLPDSKWFNYVDALGMSRSLSTWSCLEFDGLRLSTHSSGGDPFRLVMAAREGDLIPDKNGDEWKTYGGHTRDGYSNRLSFLHRMPTVHAMEVLVLSWETTLSHIRNRVASVDLQQLSSLAELQAVQLDLLSLSRDLLPVTSELVAFANDKSRFDWELPEFAPLHEFPSAEMRLFELIREGIARRAARVVQFESEIREAASAQAVLAATEEQRRATRSVITLSKVVVGLTIILVILSLIIAVLTAVLVS
jgi:hypothetical protein